MNTESQPRGYPYRRRNLMLEGIVNTVEWLLVALILAFAFRAFVMEAFRIPTGSMAETLRGDHYHLRCTRCGWAFDVGADSNVGSAQCPSCGFILDSGIPVAMSNGDRIFVLKCLYQFHDPRRWDVVVFRNPQDPMESYIKRMIALPGETLEIIDGDVYIDGRIARKPPKVQGELWMPVYVNDYQPFSERLKEAQGGRGRWENNEAWRQPFRNAKDAQWDLQAHGPTVFALDGEPDRVQVLEFDGREGKAFRATYGYNDGALNYHQPVVSDLMIEFHVLSDNPAATVGAVLGKYGRTYRGRVTFQGEMVLEELRDEGPVELVSRVVDRVPARRAEVFRLANVDHQLVLDYGDYTLRYDLGREPEAMGTPEQRQIEPTVRIEGAGRLQLRHVALYRDTYYVTYDSLRATEGEPFTLDEDEFFVCGDNSPNSLDARLWETGGEGNNGIVYRAGVVPRDFLMGKAFFIYWSNALRPTATMPAMIPNVGKVGWIYGGGPIEY